MARLFQRTLFSLDPRTLRSCFRWCFSPRCWRSSSGGIWGQANVGNLSLERRENPGDKSGKGTHSRPANARRVEGKVPSGLRLIHLDFDAGIIRSWAQPSVRRLLIGHYSLARQTGLWNS